MNTEEMLKVVKIMSKAIVKMGETLIEFMKRFTDVRKQIDKEQKLRLTWYNPKDTRLKSQVLNNKPRHLIKKIIK